VYGEVAGSPIYGAANVGNSTSYTVTNLVANKQYYFQVAAVNDCMVGPFSSEFTGSPQYGIVEVSGIAPSFDVLGEHDEIDTDNLNATESGQVTPVVASDTTAVEAAEAQTCTQTSYWWIWILLGEALILSVWTTSNQSIIRLKWLIPALVGVGAWIIHSFFAGCVCAVSLCSLHLIFNGIMVVLSAMWKK
jgi:hypothetical protein